MSILVSLKCAYKNEKYEVMIYSIHIGVVEYVEDGILLKFRSSHLPPHKLCSYQSNYAYQ